MALKIKLGRTKLDELHEIFDLSEEQLENKRARLFPLGNSDSETSTVSIFLASLSAVKEYREELFMALGINKIKSRNVQLHSYVEIQGGNNNDRPDGLLVITSGKTNPIIEWAGFVEAKISDHLLDDKQIERYTDFARENGIEEIITISNYLVTLPTMSPIKSSKRAFKFYHWSWTYLKVIAQRLINTDAIEDEDHVYILKELRRYFDTHKNVKNFITMGKDWKDAVNVIDGNNRIKKEVVDIVTNAIVQEEKDLSLQLTDKTSMLITLVAKEDRPEKISEMLCSNKIITSQYCIDNDKKKTFFIDIDFVKQEVRCYTYIVIEKGKAQAQTSTLLKMLEGDSGYQEEIIINAIYKGNKSLEKDKVKLSELIQEKENKNITNYSVLDKDLGDTVKHFEIKTKDKLGKNFTGNKTFIMSLEQIAERFVNQVMENII